MRVSVAICTWNRAELLDATLRSMHALRVPQGVEWELIVVNNNCSDHTDEVIQAHKPHLPLCRVFEPTPGHSHARNAAVRQMTGEFLVWTDDDVIVDESWIAEYVSASEAFPDAAFFAGRIDPWFEAAPPAWFARHLSSLSGVVVCVNHGDQMRPLQAREGLFGANMAVRADLARRFTFDPRFGRVGQVLTGGDDTHFVKRLVQAGHFGVWVPRARVRHFVSKDRVAAAYVERWFRDSGRTFVREQPLTGATIAGVPRWVLRNYAAETAKAWLWRPAGNERWFEAYRQSLMLRGMIQELRAAKHAVASTAAPAEAVAPPSGR